MLNFSKYFKFKLQVLGIKEFLIFLKKIRKCA